MAVHCTRYMLYGKTLCPIHLLICLVLISASGIFNELIAQTDTSSKKYYISSSGNDDDPGTSARPWKTLKHINQISLHAGEEVYLKGGDYFDGPLVLDSLDLGTAESPILINSYGKGKAIINGENGNGIELRKCRYIVVGNFIVKGNGRKNGNTGRGLFLADAENISVNQIDVSGFQKGGVEVADCSQISLKNINATNNGFAGIVVTGNYYPQSSNHHIYIGYCKAKDNPGDPTELNNHSGNGIVVGLASNVLIEFCVATNNGWDMPRKGNGPVGIWAWESDSVVIQQCISYRNHTVPGAMDGGGFDLDGGVTNSIVQYNLSYENEGYGYGIFQFSGATPWHNNIFRYNISFNDGNITQHGASILWWNGSKDSSQFHDCYIFNNLLYNSKGYALGVIPNEYDNSRFFFLNNILVAKDELMSGGNIRQEQFYGNDWWSIQSKFKINGNTSFKNWIAKTGKENLNGKIVGHNAKPDLLHPATPTLDDPRFLKKLYFFKLDLNSLLRNTGLDLKKLFHLDTGGRDFYGHHVPLGESCEPGVFEIE